MINIKKLRSIGENRKKDYGTILFDFTPEFVHAADANWNTLLDALEEAERIFKDVKSLQRRERAPLRNDVVEWLSQFKEEE